jgi:hypothetical protein
MPKNIKTAPKLDATARKHFAKLCREVARDFSALAVESETPEGVTAGRDAARAFNRVADHFDPPKKDAAGGHA